MSSASIPISRAIKTAFWPLLITSFSAKSWAMWHHLANYIRFWTKIRSLTWLTWQIRVTDRIAATMSRINSQICPTLCACSPLFSRHRWISYHSRRLDSRCRSPYCQVSSILSAWRSTISRATWARTFSIPTLLPRASRSTASSSIFRTDRIFLSYACLSTRPTTWRIWSWRTRPRIVLRAVAKKAACLVAGGRARLPKRPATMTRRTRRRTMAPSCKPSRYPLTSSQRNWKNLTLTSSIPWSTITMIGRQNTTRILSARSRNRNFSASRTSLNLSCGSKKARIAQTKPRKTKRRTKQAYEKIRQAVNEQRSRKIEQNKHTYLISIQYLTKI